MGTVFKGFWHGPELSLVHRLCLQTFIRRGHVFELYTYNPIDAGPGVIIRDANKIINREEIFYFANPVTNEPDIAPFSDLFRFKLLHEIGGWWCDVDTICLSDSIPDWEYAWTRDAPEAFPASVGSAIIAFPKNDPVIQELFNRCHNLSVNFTDRDDLGPNLISYVLGELGLPLDMSVEPDMFYPLRWIENFKLWLPEFREEIESKSVSAVFIPIFASFAKNVGIDFTRLPPTGCFLDTIFETYNPDLQSTRTRYDCGVIKDLTKSWFARHQDWAIPELVAACGENILGFLTEIDSD